MFLVGLTGGIATGKSTVSSILHDLGIPIIDADKLAREVVKPGSVAWNKIIDEFGSDVINENGEIDRKMISHIIFKNSDRRRRLNQITHREILKLILWQILKLFMQRKHDFCILDLPLLFETNSMLASFVIKKTIVVTADDKTQLNRLMERSGDSREDCLDRIQSQMPMDVKVARADYVIDNSGSFEQTAEQTHRVFDDLQNEVKKRNRLKMKFYSLVFIMTLVTLISKFIRIF